MPFEGNGDFNYSAIQCNDFFRQVIRNGSHMTSVVGSLQDDISTSVYAIILPLLSNSSIPGLRITLT